MVKNLLLSALFGAALIVGGCSDQNNSIAPQTDSSTTDDLISDADISPELRQAIEQALTEENIDTKNENGPANTDALSGNWGEISGPTIITRPGFYRVTEDFSATEEAIIIRSNFVYLFLGNHTISGPGNKMGQGIVVDGAKYAVVHGGTIESYGVGVVLKNTKFISVKQVEIIGGDEYADPLHGIAPQIGIMVANSNFNQLYYNDIKMVNLGIFIRGGDSFRNRTFKNKITGGDLGLLGICYNPDASGSPAGPHDDVVKENRIYRFRGGIQASAGAHDNVYSRNTIEYFVMPYEDVDGANTFRDNRSTMIDTPMHTLDLNFNGLEDLGPDFAYEGWVIVNGHPVTTGVFTVNGSGMMSQTSFDLSSFDLAGAAKFVLTIEPSPDFDPAPAATHFLGGDFSSDNASLTVSDEAALGDDFTGAMGPYILNTPSTGSDNTDYANGIWWLDPTAGPGPTLVLPTLPAGWVYEGWVVGPGGPITTGQFTDASGFDSDIGGPTAGPDGTPPFPGQDYINPPIPLIGYTAVITVEPSPDNSAMPFTLKPLVDSFIDDVGIGVLQDMNNNAGTFPTGSAMR